MSSVRIPLPDALTRLLNARGYVLNKGTKDSPHSIGGEKLLYEGKCTVGGQAEIVIAYTKKDDEGFLWEYEREFEVFSSLQGLELQYLPHENIVKVYELIYPDDEGRYGPCMVMEKISPVGYDLFTHHVRHQYAGTSSYRTIPLCQLYRYLQQLVGALEHMHSKGWVHCDIKVDNVLIDSKDVVKLIDFSRAREIGKEMLNFPRSTYMAPEIDPFTGNIAKPSVDMWSIGGLMAFFFMNKYVSKTWVDGASREDIIRRLDIPDPQLSLLVGGAIARLLDPDESRRMSLQEFKNWLQDTERKQTVHDNEHNTVYGTLSGVVNNTPRATSTLFHHVKPFNMSVFPRVFGFEITSNSTARTDFTRNMLGRKFSEGLDKEKYGDAICLFVQPSGGQRTKVTSNCWDACSCFKGFFGYVAHVQDEIPFPKDYKLQIGDWIFFTMGLRDENIAKMEWEVRSNEKAYPTCIEYDEFKFPVHCYGKTLEQLQLHNFNFDVAFLAKKDDSKLFTPEDALPTTIVTEEHYGLVCRIPCAKTGYPRSILTDMNLKQFFDADRFYEINHGQPEDANM